MDALDADSGVADDRQGSGAPLSTHPVWTALEVFVDELRGLRTMIPVLARAAKEAEEEARGRRQNVLGGVDHRIPEDDRARARHDRGPLHASMRTALLEPSVAATGWHFVGRDLSSAALLMMSAHFDRFIGEMIKAALEIKPEVRKSLTIQLSVSDIADLPDLKAVYRIAIEKQVEKVLRDSRGGQVDWFVKRGMIPIAKELVAELNDVAELRNLIAHHGGEVTNRIGFGLLERKTTFLRRYRAGETITITPDEIALIHDILFVAAVSIAQGVWRNLREDQRGPADKALEVLTYSRLALGEFTLVQRTLDAMHVHRKTMADETKLVNTINLAQAHKWIGDEDGCHAVLERESWDRHEGAFQFAVAVLREEWDPAATLMAQCVEAGQVERAHLEDWPVLRNFRDTPQFRETFRRSYPG